MDLRKILRKVPDFPKAGINFVDITTVLQDPAALKLALELMRKKLLNQDFDIIVAPESRGFIFGVPLAYILDKGFVPVRKKGKLPYKTICLQYDLEYGTDSLEMHADAIKPGQKVLIVDDILATAGTARTMINMVEQLGGEVAGILCLVELGFLNGREILQGYQIDSLIHFENSDLV